MIRARCHISSCQLIKLVFPRTSIIYEGCFQACLDLFLKDHMGKMEVRFGMLKSKALLQKSSNSTFEDLLQRYGFSS